MYLLVREGVLSTMLWDCIGGEHAFFTFTLQEEAHRMNTRQFRILIFSLMFSALAWAPAQPAAASRLTEALTTGKVSLDVRYRYEWVDQANLGKKAHASTLRSRLGYTTGVFMGVSGFLEFEDVTVIGNEQYNSTANGMGQYPVVADPGDTEINQAYLKFTGVEHLSVTGGRQRIKLDNDRFIGNVGWRQNEQTFDAVRFVFSPMEGLTGTYIYLENVNRIFGAHHPNPANANSRMESHLAHAAYNRLSVLKVSVYGYWLDFDDAPTASNQTLGLRLNGVVPVGRLKMQYTAEYADQSDYAGGLSTNDAEYFLGEIGLSGSGVSVKAGAEWLGGDGVYGFQTPLATLHAFQGWADKFLVTPANGVKDLYAAASAKVAGIKFVAVYHVFTSDKANIDYGTELDLLAVKKLSDHYLVGIKYAHYDADSDMNNTGGTAVDVEKLWLTAQVTF